MNPINFSTIKHTYYFEYHWRLLEFTYLLQPPPYVFDNNILFDALDFRPTTNTIRNEEYTLERFFYGRFLTYFACKYPNSYCIYFGTKEMAQAIAPQIVVEKIEWFYAFNCIRWEESPSFQGFLNKEEYQNWHKAIYSNVNDVKKDYAYYAFPITPQLVKNYLQIPSFFPFYYSFVFGLSSLAFLQSALRRPTVENLLTNTALTVHLQLGHPDYEEGFWDYILIQSKSSLQKDIQHNVEAFSIFGQKYEELMESIDWKIEDNDWRKEVFLSEFTKILEEYTTQQFTYNK